MAEGITFRLTVQDDGTAAIEKMDGSFKKFDDTVKKTEKTLGSVASSARGFATQLAGAMGIYFGIGGALEAIQMGLQAEQAEESFKRVSEAAGANANEIIAAMRRATAGTVDESDMMQKAVKAITLDIPPEKLEALAETARATARITGGIVGETFERITDAIATNMPRSLKQMGLVTKEQMSLFNKAMAEGVEGVSLLELVLENSQKQMGMLGEVTDNNAEAWQRLKAEIKDFVEGTGSTLAGILFGIIHPLEFMKKSLAKNTEAADAYLDELEMLRQVADGFNKENKPEAIKPEMVYLGEEGRYLKQKRYMPTITGPTWEERTKAAIEEEKTRKKQLEEAKKFEAEREKLVERAKEKTLEARIPEYEAPDEKEMRKMEERTQMAANKMNEQRAKLEEDATEKMNQIRLEGGLEYEAATEKQQREMNIRTIEREKKAAEDAMKPWVELTERTANAMEQNFSDFFFDTMTGKFKTFAEMMTGIFRSIQRAAADYLGQSLTEAIFGGKTASGGRAGGIIESFGGMKGISDWLKGGMGLFGGGAAAGAGAAASTGGPLLLGDALEAAKFFNFHKGGIVGASNIPSIMAPIGLLANAVRLHLGTDEYPAILQRGERVIPKDKGSSSLTINVPISAPGRAKLASALRTEIESTVEKVIRRHS